MSAESPKPTKYFETCSVVLLDIAGTITSNSFVKSQIYAYAIKHMEEFLKANWDEKNVKEAVKSLKDTDLDVEKAVDTIKEFTDAGSNNSGFKKLQALVCEKGFKDGTIKTRLFPDVPAALKSWSKSRKVAIYSNGNILGQQLSLIHTTEGDLSTCIQKFFDDEVGPKTEAESYKAIAKQLGVEPEEIVYITDLVEEAKAAKEAKLAAVLVKREGNDPISEDVCKQYTNISSFSEISFEKITKRKIEEDAAPVEEQPPTKIAKTGSTEHVEEKTTVSTEEVNVEQKSDEVMEVDTVPDNKPKENTDDQSTAKTEQLIAQKEEKNTEISKATPMETKESDNSVTSIEDKEVTKSEETVNIDNKTEIDVEVEQKKDLVSNNKAGTNEQNTNEDSKEQMHNTEAKSIEKSNEKPAAENVGNECTEMKSSELEGNKSKDAPISAAVVESSTVEAGEDEKLSALVEPIEDSKMECNETKVAEIEKADIVTENKVETVIEAKVGTESAEKVDIITKEIEVDKQKTVEENSITNEKKENQVESAPTEMIKDEAKPTETNKSQEPVEDSVPVDPTNDLKENCEKEANKGEEKNEETSTGNDKIMIEEDKKSNNETETKSETVKESTNEKNVDSKDEKDKEINKENKETTNEQDKETTNEKDQECKDEKDKECQDKKVEEVKDNNINEKENKSDLANGIECPSEKLNGEVSKVSSSLDDKIEKIEEPVESTPSISVEV